MRLDEDARFGGLFYRVVAGCLLPWEWLLHVNVVFCRAAVVWGSAEFRSVGGVSFVLWA